MWTLVGAWGHGFSFYVNRMNLAISRLSRRPATIPPEGGGEGEARGCRAGGSSRKTQGSAPSRRTQRRSLGRIANRGPRRVQGDGDRPGRRRRRRAAQPRDRRGEDDDPLGLRGDLPRPGAEPAGRPGPARPRPRRRRAALARDPDLLRPLPRRLHPPRPHRDPADRARGRALASQLPTYVKDFESWATNNEQFRELNDKYDITALLSNEASQLPAKLGDAAGAAKEITVGILNNIVEAVVVLTLTFFLLIDGGQQFRTAHRAARRARARLASAGSGSGSRTSSAPTSRSTCCSRRSPASSPGFARAARGRAGGPAGGAVAFLDLVPLIGFTVGGRSSRSWPACTASRARFLIWLAPLHRLPAGPGPRDPADLLQERGPASTRRSP